MLKRGIYKIIIGPSIELPDLHVRLHALERSEKAAKSAIYNPVRLLPNEKITTSDKLLVALDALAVGRLTGRLSRTGKIIHGARYKVASFPLPSLLAGARTNLARIAALGANASPPALALNKHCSECVF